MLRLLIVNGKWKTPALRICASVVNYEVKKFPRVVASSFHRVIFVILATLLLFFTPYSAAAHPLDEFYQVTFISIGPNRIDFNIELYPGVLVAPTLLPLIDTNQDGQISEAEQAVYVDRFIGDLQFELDGQPVPLHLNGTPEFPEVLDITAGNGVIYLNLVANLPPNHRGEHTLFYKNDHLPDVGSYIVSALSGDPQWVQIDQQDRDVFQQSIQLNYTIDPAAPLELDADTSDVLAEVELPEGIAPSEGQKWLTDYLRQPELPAWLIMVILGVAIALGGLHAMTPGHGKTLVAAYLVGSRGTVLHAVFLGGIVTFTHTASVVVIGLLALVASQFIVPNVLVPALEVLSGALVIFIGVQLILQRYKVYQGGGAVHHHAHHHHHPHDHSHDDDHGHSHDIPENVKIGDLLALGVSGGLVPCPEALGIMLIAIGLNRIMLGLGMVVAFSFGLAAVLIVIGILLVRTKSLLDRVTVIGERWQSLLPLVSAVIVTLLGLVILLKGLMPYLEG